MSAPIKSQGELDGKVMAGRSYIAGMPREFVAMNSYPVHPGRSHSRKPNATSATLPTPQNQSATNHSRRCLSGRSVNDSRSRL
jgi:hypothetical protein